MRRQYSYDYPRPMVTVDIIVLSRINRKPHVLLIKRKRSPFKGKWALPGGFIEMEESLEEAARRELMEETGMSAGELKQIAAFGDPHRDPRGRTISIAFLTRVRRDETTVKAMDDAADARWFPLTSLPPLAFDHAQIIATAVHP